MRPFRVIFALVFIVALLALPFHVSLEPSGNKAPEHTCHICAAGAWAIVSVGPILDSTMLAVGEKQDVPRVAVESEPADPSAPRGPPLA